jgi:hypothetical protein
MPRKNLRKKSNTDIILIQARAEPVADHMTRLMIRNGSVDRWLDLPESETDQYIIVFNRVEGLRAMFGPSFRHFLTPQQAAAFAKFAAFCDYLDHKESDTMCAKQISFEDFESEEIKTAEDDYQLLCDYGERLHQAHKQQQRERVRYLLKGVQQVHRLVFDYKPNKPDAIDKELDELAGFFNDDE